MFANEVNVYQKFTIWLASSKMDTEDSTGQCDARDR